MSNSTLMNQATELKQRARRPYRATPPLRYPRQKGYIALTSISIIIPALLLLLLVGIDCVGYFRAKQELHSVLERELEIFSRLINNRKAAEALLADRLRSELNKLNIELESANVIWKEVSPPQADITLSAQYKLIFSRPPIIDRIVRQVSIPIRANASIQIAPINAAIVIDASHTSAPSTNDIVDPLWFPDGISTGASWFYSAPSLYLNNTPVPPQTLSLRCFNSQISPIKRAAVTLVDLLQLFGAKEVSLSFLSDRESDFSRPSLIAAQNRYTPSGSSPPNNLIAKITYLNSIPIGRFIPYIGFLGRDVWCAAAASQEQLYYNLFGLPPLPKLAVDWGLTAASPVQTFTSTSPPEFSADYLLSSPLREQIWYRAASEQDNNSSWYALSRASDLILGNLEPASKIMAEEITRNIIYVVTNKLPSIDSQLLAEYVEALKTISQQLNLLNQRLTLIFFIVNPKELAQIQWFIAETNKAIDSSRLKLQLEILPSESVSQQTQIVHSLTKLRRMVRYIER